MSYKFLFYVGKDIRVSYDTSNFRVEIPGEEPAYYSSLSDALVESIDPIVVRRLRRDDKEQAVKFEELTAMLSSIREDILKAVEKFEFKGMEER